MAWNRSTEPVKPVKKEVPPSMLKGIVVGLAAVAVCVAAFLIFSGGDDKPKAKPEKKPAAIKEVKPAAAPKAKPVEEKDPKGPYVIGKRGIPIPTYGLKTYWDNGVLRYEGGLRVIDPNRATAEPIKTKSYQIFNRSSLDSIASLINMQPGDFITGDIEYGDDFIKDFNDSLSEQIAYDEKDSDYVRDVKDAVKEIQKDLHARMNAGEDIAAIMNETRQDLRNLFLYRQEILEMVSQSTDDPDMSDVDAEDVIKAANMMFREKGIREIEDGDVVRWSLILEAKRKSRAGQVNDAQQKEERDDE